MYASVQSYNHIHEWTGEERPIQSRQIVNFNSRGGIDDATMQPDELKSSPQLFLAETRNARRKEKQPRNVLKILPFSFY